MWSFVSLSFPLTWGSSSVEINLQHLNLTTSPIQHRAEDFLGGEDVSPLGVDSVHPWYCCYRDKRTLGLGCPPLLWGPDLGESTCPVWTTLMNLSTIQLMDLWIVRDSKANFSNQMFVQVPVPENYFALLKCILHVMGSSSQSWAQPAPTQPGRAWEGVALTYLYISGSD